MTNETCRRSEHIEAMRAWLLEKNLEVRSEDLDENADFIAMRVIDSFALVELMLLIEELSGRPVLGESFVPSDMRTLGRIYARYFVDSPSSEHQGSVP